MLILFPFFRELGRPRSNCAVLLSAASRRREKRKRARMRLVKNRRRGGSLRFSSWRRDPAFTIVPVLTVFPPAFSSRDDVIVVPMPDDVDDSFVWLPNGLNVPFELRREVVSAKVTVAAAAPAVSSRLSVWPLVDFTSPAALQSSPAAGRLLNPHRLRLLKSREVRRVSPSRRYIQGTRIVRYAGWLHGGRFIARSQSARFDLPAWRVQFQKFTLQHIATVTTDVTPPRMSCTCDFSSLF